MLSDIFVRNAVSCGCKKFRKRVWEKKGFLHSQTQASWVNNYLFSSMLRHLNFFPWNNDRENEIRQLTKTVKRMMTVQKRKVQGISDIVFTVGLRETDAFGEDNKTRRGRGESYFVRLKNDIGSRGNVVVAWKKVSSDKEEFLTGIVMSSTQPNHEHFLLGNGEGYSLYIHPEMRGIRSADPTLCLWFEKDAKKSRFIADVRVSYTKVNKFAS